MHCETVLLEGGSNSSFQKKQRERVSAPRGADAVGSGALCISVRPWTHSEEL